MTLNTKGFFSWQGNNLEFQSWIKWIMLGLMIVILLLLWIFKGKIANRFDRKGKMLFFKNQNHMWRWVGLIGLLFSAFRLIIMWVMGYPLYWEGLAMHLCRLHLWIIFFLLIFGRVKWIKYITYISIIGAIFGIMFDNMQSDVINSYTSANNGYVMNGAGAIAQFGDPRFTTYESLSLFTGVDGITPWSQIDKLAYLNGLTHYTTGFDNYFTYDFALAHLSLVFFPLFTRAAYRLKYNNNEFFRTQVLYIGATLLMWVINVAMGQISSPNWRANYWFIGLDANNDQFKALGSLSGWPQNLFSYCFIGYLVTWLFHSIWFATAKIQFFERKKWYQIKIVKSQPRQDFLNGFKKGWFKDIFIINRK